MNVKFSLYFKDSSLLNLSADISLHKPPYQFCLREPISIRKFGFDSDELVSYFYFSVFNLEMGDVIVAKGIFMIKDSGGNIAHFKECKLIASFLMDETKRDNLKKQTRDLCYEIEGLPASEQQTKISLMASKLLRSI